MQAAAAVSILEICDKLEPETFLPYLDSVVQGLLGLLDPAGTPAMECLYVQVQAIATLRFVADAGQHTFAKVLLILLLSNSTFWNVHDLYKALSNNHAMVVQRSKEPRRCRI